MLSHASVGVKIWCPWMKSGGQAWRKDTTIFVITSQLPIQKPN